MIWIVVALVALNVATQLLAMRREQRLLDALMTRTPQEYIAAKRADSKDKPKPRPDAAEPEYIIPIGI